ncbi:UNVERIFIED_CONTAM: hypothetical protein Slati_0486800 [Sesamum latifolium]|uniref:CCHC-type domain-containing protein n=1 Tax=Sesamum latifolium TaxID=2727402 RepID=A0AAW2Y000_9LAMI
MGQSLRLTEREGGGEVIPDGLWSAASENHQLFLVGRLLSNKQPKFEALASSIKSMLNPVKGLKMRRLEGGRFLIRFNHIIDRNQTLEGCPWSFKKNTLIFSGLGINENPLNVNLDWCKFYVHVHDLPLSKMNSSGTLWGNSAIWRWTSLGEEVVVSFTHERLQNFCYLCGRLGHLSAVCELRFEEGFQDPGESSARGPAVFGRFEGRHEPAVSSAHKGKGAVQDEPVDTQQKLKEGLEEEVQSASSDSLALHIPEMGVLETGEVHGHRRNSESECRGTRGLMAKRRRGRRRITRRGVVGSKRVCEIQVLEHGIEAGLGPLWIVRMLAELVRRHNPALVFLLETKCKKRKCAILKEKFNLFGINVDSRGKADSLMLLWRKDINLVVHSFSTSHIDATVSTDEGTDGWRFTGIYGQPDATKRSKTWKLLRSLSIGSFRLWICAGDFNEILSLDEKTGAPRPCCQIEEFRSCPLDCQLVDLSYSGSKFTWCNQCEALNTVRVRLDRACMMLGWKTVFPLCQVCTKEARGSDHTPLNINIAAEMSQSSTRRNRLFRFEGCGSVHQTMKILFNLSEIMKWRAPPLREVKELEEKLSGATTDLISAGNSLMRSRLRQELDEVLTREEIMWKQRGKAQWLRTGDRNTPFFHARASARKRKNSIMRLRTPSRIGVTLEKESSISSPHISMIYLDRLTYLRKV